MKISTDICITSDELFEILKLAGHLDKYAQLESIAMATTSEEYNLPIQVIDKVLLQITYRQDII